MPVQAVMKNGERYYRWGSEGKLYKDRNDAEAQGRAAYASGYREKSDSMSNTKKKVVMAKYVGKDIAMAGVIRTAATNALK